MANKMEYSGFPIYLFYIPIVIASILITYGCYVIVKIELNSMLFLLSAFIQSLSTIIAIVITITLITVQLSSTEYSIRLLFIIRKDLYFNTTIIIYLFSIVYDAIFLSAIHEIDEETVEMWFTISIMTFSLSLFILIPYVYRVLDLLKPENVIAELKKELSKNYLTPGKALKELVEDYKDLDRVDIVPYYREPATRGLTTIKDKFVPLLEVIKRAIEKDDTYTIHVGINILGAFHEELCSKNDLSKEEKKYITRLILRHIRRICRKAIQCEDRGAIHDALQCMNKIIIASTKFEREEPITGGLHIFKIVYEEAYNRGKWFGSSGWIRRVGSYMCDLYVKLKAQAIDNLKIMVAINKLDRFIKKHNLPTSIHHVFREYDKHLKNNKPKNHREKHQLEKIKKIFTEFKEIYNQKYGNGK